VFQRGDEGFAGEGADLLVGEAVRAGGLAHEEVGVDHVALVLEIGGHWEPVAEGEELVDDLAVSGGGGELHPSHVAREDAALAGVAPDLGRQMEAERVLEAGAGGDALAPSPCVGFGN